MKPLPFVCPYAPVFWLVFLWAFWPEYQIVKQARVAAGRDDSPDAGSTKVIMLGGFLASMAAFPLASVRRLQWPVSMHPGLFVAGVAVLVAGSLLRRHCWRMLGDSFTGDVRAHAEQQVITSGAYALVRHPSYTAGILMYTGIGIALGSWASTGLLLVASIAVYIYRIRVEERVLVTTIGEPYRAFMRGRKRLVPFIY